MRPGAVSRRCKPSRIEAVAARGSSSSSMRVTVRLSSSNLGTETCCPVASVKMVRLTSISLCDPTVLAAHSHNAQRHCLTLSPAQSQDFCVTACPLDYDRFQVRRPKRCTFTYVGAHFPSAPMTRTLRTCAARRRGPSILMPQ